MDIGSAAGGLSQATDRRLARRPIHPDASPAHVYCHAHTYIYINPCSHADNVANAHSGTGRLSKTT